MGSPAFSVPVFEALFQLYPQAIRAVYTQPDKPKGRGQQLEATAVKQWALSKGLSVVQPLNKQSLEASILPLKLDLVVVVAYGMIIPKTITDSILCVNIHASLLPSYRGASPIQSALLNGDSQTGVTIMKLNEKMDEGPILSQKTIPILPSHTLQGLTDDLSVLGRDAFVEWLQTASAQGIESVAQDSTKASYCTKVTSDMAELLTTDSQDLKYRKIKAFSPKPGAWLLWQGKRLKILDAIKNLEGQVLPTWVQLEGKKAIDFKAFCLGYPEAKLHSIL